MTVFACAGCGAVLTAPLSQVALPVHAHQSYGHAMLPALMEPGTYAVDPHPSGPPWRLWGEITTAEAEAQGWYAPVHAVSLGPRGAVVIAPGDVRGTVLIPDRCDGYCMGLDGRDGPNLACTRCGRAVATRIDDCSLWQAVWLDPRAVRPLPGEPDDRAVLDWDDLQRERPGTPPVEQPGRWNPIWEAAAGAALAHLLAVSDGAPVAVPEGLVADVFGRALDALSPAGLPAKSVALGGPGLAAAAADILLVPVHPQTGKAWRPPREAAKASGGEVLGGDVSGGDRSGGDRSGGDRSGGELLAREPSGGEPSARMELGGGRPGRTVPLAADVWVRMAFPSEWEPVAVVGGVPEVVWRDDPPPLLPVGPFRPDSGVFLSTLVRLPEVRRPWLRSIYDQVRERPYSPPF
ncbi:hypothetical protein [Actinomadura montaniterrae]|uniref:Uncharacterized protein n=1 Tax=Actinomadura montaniterrae TaxID=1803903 RepID=A0A6L3VFY9_9ACTN|nr:hypothetical protein [Actinomadura montaniterrae]KAB2357770.1 hypothetical protein F9B16_48255 [Actinomadura montaniterrae]